MRELRVKVNQIELQVQEHGRGEETIIFLHFSGANLMMWQRIIPDFQDQYRLLLVDLRGHGKSDKPETGYHMDEMARDIVEMMQQLDLDKAHIIGSSLGAEVGLSMAANYPEKILSLVCDGALCSEYGPYGTWEGSEEAFEEHVANHLGKIRSKPEPIFDSVDAFLQARQDILGDWWNEYVEAMARYDVQKVGEGEYTKGFPQYAMAAYMEHYYHYRFEDYYPRVKCPLLMLVEKDLEDGPEKNAIYGLKALAERAEAAEIDGWAHPYCWFLGPDDAVKAILEFLR